MKNITKPSEEIITYAFENKRIYLNDLKPQQRNNNIDNLIEKYKNNKTLKKLDNTNTTRCNRCYRLSDYNIYKKSEEKEIIGVIGSSSSGKSTVAEILNEKLPNIEWGVDDAWKTILQGWETFIWTPEWKTIVKDSITEIPQTNAK